MPSAAQLMKGNIRFKVRPTSQINDVTFHTKLWGISFCGVLSLPLLNIHGEMKHHLLNMLALERLHGPMGNDLSSFLYFLNNLINTAKDVKKLREKDVLVHSYGSDDDDVAKLINSLQGLVLNK